MSEITYYRNDTVGITIKLRDKKTLAAIDLTGKSLLLTVDPSEAPADDSTKLMQLSGAVQAPATDGIVVFTPASGVGTNSDFTPGDYWYDVQIENTADQLQKQTLVKDRFYHKQDISKT